MSVFDLGQSLLSAQRRFARAGRGANAKRAGRRTNLGRSDKGHARVHPRIEQFLQTRLQGREKPSMTSLGREVAALCAELGVAPPARGTLYNAVARARPPRYSLRELPQAVQEALYNLGPTAASSDEVRVPGDQIVFYCFNYGDVRAISFAAGMPWLSLVGAVARRGFRPKSLALLRAVMKARGL